MLFNCFVCDFGQIDLSVHPNICFVLQLYTGMQDLNTNTCKYTIWNEYIY